MAEEYKYTEKYLNKYGSEVVREIKTRVPKASLELEKSVGYKVSKEDFSLLFFMNEYGKYVDKGVTGHGVIKGFKGKKKQVNKGQFDKYTGRTYAFKDKMPPEKALTKWLKIKGIDQDSSFVIRRSIWMFGIKPTNFFTIPTTRRQKQFEKGLGDAIAKDIDAQLEKELKK